MATGGKFSLAAALFDWPVADGFASPTVHAPVTWRAQFASGAVPWVFEGLFTACRGGRDWALQNAPKLAVILESDEPPSLQELTSVRRMLTTRGQRASMAQENNTERTTSLNVYLPSSIQFIAALHTLTGLLHGAAGAAVTELEIIGVSDAADWLDHTTQDNIMLFMRQCGFAFPALTKLTIHDCPVALPPAEQLPCVRDLDLQGLNMDLVMNLEEMEGLEETMNEHDEALCRILAGYLPGLATLSLKKCVGARGEHLSLVFTPASSRQALTSFSTDAPLTGELTRLLVAHAPELKQLSVGWLLHHHVDDDQDADIGPEWKVRELHVSGDYPITSAVLLSLPRLSDTAARLHLNLGQHGRMLITVDRPEGFSPRLAQCLSSLDVSCDGDINVECQPELPEQAEPLCNALQTLKGLRIRSKDTVVYLRDWDWPQLQVQRVTDALSELQHLRLGVRSVHEHSFPDILPLAQHAPYLKAPSASLDSHQHVNTPWPWRKLTLDTLDIADLCKLPDPTGSDGPRQVEVLNLVIDGQRITEAGVEAVVSRVRCITFSGKTLITFPYTEGHTDAQLTVAKAIQWAKNNGPQTWSSLSIQRLKLTGWPMDTTTRGVLAQLPTWHLMSDIDLTECQFPLKMAQYKSLGQWFPGARHYGFRVPRAVKEGILKYYSKLGQKCPFPLYD